MVIPDSYRGREQALIKHTLLRQYLERLFMIIGQSEEDICYVDCFAGPWQNGGANLQDTSIAISLDIMEKCRRSLAGLSRNVRFRALFVERNRESYDRLRTFLQRPNWPDIERHAVHGEFYDLRQTILEWCGTSCFTFFFVDPTGWKDGVEIPTLRPLLERGNSEFLITFMSDFILRFHAQGAFEAQMEQIFGQIPDTSGMFPEERERYLTQLYLDHLKGCQSHDRGRPRAAYVKVLYPHRDRTMYNLVYLTRHPLGIVVFMTESEKIDGVQKTIRARAKQNRRIGKTGQGELFDAASMEYNTDRSVDLTEVKEYWLDQLSLTPRRFGIEELASMLEETGWFISEFQRAFGELQLEKRVTNLDARRMRPIHVVHFDSNAHSGEYLARIGSDEQSDVD